MPVPGVNGTMSLMGAWLDVSTLGGVFCAEDVCCKQKSGKQGECDAVCEVTKFHL